MTNNPQQVHLLLIVCVRRVWGTLGAGQPFNVPQPPSDLLLLLVRPRHLLLLAGAELQLLTLIAAARRCTGTARHCAARCTGRSRSRPRVLEPIHIDRQVSLGCQTSSIHVPLLRAERADKFFVVRDHDYSALVFSDRDRQAAYAVAVKEIGRLVKNEQVGIVLPCVSNLPKSIKPIRSIHTHMAPANTTLTFCPPLRPEI